jgi:hypothetical protein
MLAQFLAALEQKLIEEVPTHLTHEAVDYINESRRERERHANTHETADYTNQSPRDRDRYADVIGSVVNGFLLAIKNQDEAKALALCKPGLRQNLIKQGVADTFSGIRNYLVRMSDFQHAAPKWGILKTTCELTGTIHYEEGDSCSYSISAVRSFERTDGHGWKVGEFLFVPIPGATSAGKAPKPGS